MKRVQIFFGALLLTCSFSTMAATGRGGYSSANEMPSSSRSSGDFGKIRMAFGPAVINFKDQNQNSSSYGKVKNFYGASMNLGLGLTRDFTLNFFSQMSRYANYFTTGDRGYDFYNGAEADLVILHLGDEFFEFGPVLGASFRTKLNPNERVVHYGGRMTFNYDRNWGVSMAARTNLSSTQGEAGLLVHF